MIIKAVPNLDIQQTWQQKLKSSSAQEWKNTLSIGVQGEPRDLLQDVLDVLSPIKSPVKSSFSDTIVVEGYTIFSKVLGEGQNKVHLATHEKTKRTVLSVD